MQEIERVTTDLEKGNSDSLMKALVATYIEESVRYLQAVQKQNVRHLTDKETTAVLGVAYDGPKSSPFEVSISRSLDGFRNFFSNPAFLYVKRWNSQIGEQEFHNYTDPRS